MPEKLHIYSINMVLNIFIQFLLFSLVLIPESSAIRVRVTYSRYANDELRFATADTSICSRYNARYVQKKNGEVVCQCSSRKIFFGIDGKSPKCRKENSGRLYGEMSSIYKK